MNRLITIFMLLIISVSCSNDKKELKMMKVTELSAAKISDSVLVQLLEHDINKPISIKYTLMEDSALKYLYADKVDLAILPNNTTGKQIDANLRAIAPLLPRILVILKKDVSDSVSGIKELFEGQTLIFEDLSRLDTVFFRNFFQSFDIEISKIHGINVNDINIDTWNDSSFVFVGLTHLHNPIMKKLLDRGAEFVPLDDVGNLGKGSAAEGFIIDFPSADTFVLPRSYYHGKPERPVLTISILDILVCLEDEDYNTVYQIAKNLVEKKAQLVREDNIYSMLPTDLKNQRISFPYHSATIAFINRDKPPIWSRYASIIWPIVSMMAILIGLIASMRQRIKMRQKHRIEIYYDALLRVRTKALEHKSFSKNYLDQLDKIRLDAFKALSRDKLVANESFSIFLQLYHEIKKEISEQSY